MKNKLILAALIAASSLNAQSFVAGWDFDNVAPAGTSMTSNWGDLSGSALLTWSHSPASGPPTFTPAEFGISGGFNSAVVGNTFAFVDPNTGYDQFSDPAGNGDAENGFRSISSGDSFTFTFDGSGYTGLTLTYAIDTTGTGNSWASSGSVDLSAFSGTFVLNTTAGALYDNFAVTGTVVPEPSQFAMLAGMMALLFVAKRRRK